MCKRKVLKSISETFRFREINHSKLESIDFFFCFFAFRKDLANKLMNVKSIGKLKFTLCPNADIMCV